MTEIKKAYLDKAKKYHPDANPTDPKASETFQKIQQAYETLSDADTKIEYDRNHVKRSTYVLLLYPHFSFIKYDNDIFVTIFSSSKTM